MLKARAQNGYAVREPSDTRVWTIPGTTRKVRLDQGWAGFLLVHFATFYDRQIEPVDQGQLDDWGWAVRPVRGQDAGYSNHAAGLAIDLNALKHPRGKRGTYSKNKRAALQLRLRVRYRGMIRGGEFYASSPCDGMHFEVVAPWHKLLPFAKTCARSPYGLAVIRANPDFARSHGLSHLLP